MIYSSNLECLPLAGSHKQQSRTNQTWTRTRALDSKSRQRSISPRYHSTRKRCPAGSHSPNLRSDDIAAPNSTTAYHPPSRADSRIRKKTAPERKLRIDPDGPTAGGTPRGADADRPSVGASGRRARRSMATARRMKWGEVDTGRRHPTAPLRSAGNIASMW